MTVGENTDEAKVLVGAELPRGAGKINKASLGFAALVLVGG